MKQVVDGEPKCRYRRWYERNREFQINRVMKAYWDKKIAALEHEVGHSAPVGEDAAPAAAADAPAAAATAATCEASTQTDT